MHKILDSQWDPELFWADVTIYGAGVAGLTAAHELAERGFRVRVVERARACDQHGAPSMAIGGMARTQYALVDRKTGGWWKENQHRSFVDWLAEDAKSDLGELSDDLSGTRYFRINRIQQLQSEGRLDRFLRFRANGPAPFAAQSRAAS